jgi:hypothetical protein
MTTIASLLKRVERIEAQQHVGAPKGLVAFRSLTDAKLQWGCIVIPSEQLTVEEWEMQTAHLRGAPFH